MQYDRREELRKLVVANQRAGVSPDVLYPALEFITQKIAVVFEHINSREIRSKILAIVVVKISEALRVYSALVS